CAAARPASTISRSRKKTAASTGPRRARVPPTCRDWAPSRFKTTTPALAGREHEPAGARAFSSEVDSGSREENASKQDPGASVVILSEPKMLQASASAVLGRRARNDLRARLHSGARLPRRRSGAMAFVVVQRRLVLGAGDRQRRAAPCRQHDQRRAFAQAVIQPRQPVDVVH